MHFLICVFLFVFITGCGGTGTVEEKKKMGDAAVTDSGTNMNSGDVESVNLKEAVKKTAIINTGTMKSVLIKEDSAVTQMNNNMIYGNFIIPYQNGYFYGVDSGQEDGPDDILVYEDAKGNVFRQKEWQNILFVRDDDIYYYTPEGLKRKRNGDVENIITFQSSAGRESYYVSEDYIYYSVVDEEQGKTYIGKVDYDGKQKQILCELDIWVEQIYLYEDKIWFQYCEFSDTDKEGLGQLDINDFAMEIYENIQTDSKFTVNDGYIYFNSSGLKRLNVNDNLVETLFEKNVDGVNFIGDSILFYKDKYLYKINSKGLKRLKKLKGKTAGYGGIRVDHKKVYIQTYAGSFYTGFYEMDQTGKTIKHWDSEETTKKISSSSGSNKSIIKGKEMVEYQGWIYYSNLEKGGRIYRQSIDGLRLEKLNDAKSDYINIAGNRIYYRQVRDHAVCKMGLDGSDNIIIYEGVINDLMYLDDELYFIEPSLEGSYLYRLDGEKKIKIINENIENITAVGDWIYYSVIGEESINRFSRKSAEKEVLYQGAGPFTVGKNEIYFCEQKNSNLCKMNLDGSKISIIKKSTQIQMLDVINESIYYLNGQKVFCIHDGDAEELVSDADGPIIDFSISDNGLLYTYVEKLDGKERIRQKLEL